MNKETALDYKPDRFIDKVRKHFQTIVWSYQERHPKRFEIKEGKPPLIPYKYENKLTESMLEARRDKNE